MTKNRRGCFLLEYSVDESFVLGVLGKVSKQCTTAL